LRFLKLADDAPQQIDHATGPIDRYPSVAFVSLLASRIFN
jgi:hypothetical protein